MDDQTLYWSLERQRAERIEDGDEGGEERGR